MALLNDRGEQIQPSDKYRELPAGERDTDEILMDMLDYMSLITQNLDQIQQLIAILIQEHLTDHHDANIPNG